MKNIKDIHPHSLANFFLVKVFGDAGFRDERELNQAKYYTKVTLENFKDVLENFEGSKEELVSFIDTNIEGLELFKINKKIK